MWTAPDIALISANTKTTPSNHHQHSCYRRSCSTDFAIATELPAVEEEERDVLNQSYNDDGFIPIMTAAVPLAQQSQLSPEAENWDDDFVFQAEPSASTSSAPPGKRATVAAAGNNNRDSIAWDEEDDPNHPALSPLIVPRNGKARELEEELAWDDSPGGSLAPTPAKVRPLDASLAPSPRNWTTGDDEEDAIKDFSGRSSAQRYQEYDRTATSRASATGSNINAAPMSNNTSSTSLHSGSQNHAHVAPTVVHYRSTSPTYVPASPVTISSALSMGASSTAHLQTHASTSKPYMLAYQAPPPPRARRRLKKKTRPPNESGWISAGGGAGGDIFEMEDTGGEGFPEELEGAVPGPSAHQTSTMVSHTEHRNPSRNSLIVRIPTPLGQHQQHQQQQLRSPPPSVPSSPSGRQAGHTAFLSRIGSMKSWSRRRKSSSNVTSGDEEGESSRGYRTPRRQSIASSQPPLPTPSSPRSSSWMFRARSGSATPAHGTSPSKAAGDVLMEVVTEGTGALGLNKKGSISERSNASRRERGPSISKVLGGLGFGAGSSSEDSPAGVDDDEAGKVHPVRTRASYGILARATPSSLPPVPVPERTTPPKQVLSSMASSPSFLAVKRTVGGHRRNKSVGADSLSFIEDIISEADKEKSRLAAFSPALPDPHVTPRPSGPSRSVSVGGSIVPSLVVLPDTYSRVGTARGMGALDEADPFSTPSRQIAPRLDVGATSNSPSSSPFLSLSPPSPIPPHPPHHLHHRLPSPSPSSPSSTNTSPRPHSAASRPLTTSASHPYSYSLGRANGVSLLNGAGDDPASTTSTMRRNNSLGDLKKNQEKQRQHPLGHLKIPARISQLQVGLRRDLELVRDFATSVDDLKRLQTAYSELVLQSQVHDNRDTGDESDRPSTPSATIRRIQERYALWWECADVLIELGGGSSAEPAYSPHPPPPPPPPPALRPTSPTSHHPVISASTTDIHLQSEERPSQRERAVTLAGGSSPNGGGPSTASGGGRELNPRQLGLLRRMLNEPDPAVFELKAFSMTPTPTVPKMGGAGGGTVDHRRQPPPPNPIFRSQSQNQSLSQPQSLHPNLSAVTLPESASPRISSDASSSVQGPSTTSVSENVTPERVEQVRNPLTRPAPPMTPRRINRVNAGFGVIRDMLKGLKKGGINGNGQAGSPGRANDQDGGANSSSAGRPKTPSDLGANGLPLPPPPTKPLGHRRTKTSSGAHTVAEEQPSSGVAYGRRPSEPLPQYLGADPTSTVPQQLADVGTDEREEPPLRPYASQAARQVKQSPRKPSLASLFRLGQGSGLKEKEKEKEKERDKEGRKRKKSGLKSGMDARQLAAGGSDESEWDRIDSASDLEFQMAATTPSGSGSRNVSDTSRSVGTDGDLANDGSATYGQATVRGKKRPPVTSMISPSQSSLSLRGSPQPQKRSMTRTAAAKLASAVTGEAGHTSPAIKNRSLSAQYSHGHLGPPTPPLAAAQFDPSSEATPQPRHQKDRSFGNTSTIRSAPPTSHGYQAPSAALTATAPAPSNKLALTPENIQPLLEYAREVSARCDNCVAEMRNEVARM
ncbi:hypothetical protein FRB95_009760 [Tulasnella sp. JGI-2019a]|nr:hypothetical protein FRB95_009760 [Tulasnella sp. JGI-2019a]